MYRDGGKVVRYTSRYSLYRLIRYLYRNRNGKIIKAAPFQSSVKSGEVSRIEPNKKWFGKLANTQSVMDCCPSLQVIHV